MIALCCSYGADVFEYAERPVVEWNMVVREVKKLGIRESCQVRVEQMMEDWLLDDQAGICTFLQLKKGAHSVVRRNGLSKDADLFQSGQQDLPEAQQRKSSLAGLESILDIKI